MASSADSASPELLAGEACIGRETGRIFRAARTLAYARALPYHGARFHRPGLRPRGARRGGMHRARRAASVYYLDDTPGGPSSRFRLSRRKSRPASIGTLCRACFRRRSETLSTALSGTSNASCRGNPSGRGPAWIAVRSRRARPSAYCPRLPTAPEQPAALRVKGSSSSSSTRSAGRSRARRARGAARRTHHRRRQPGVHTFIAAGVPTRVLQMRGRTGRATLAAR